MAPVQPQRQHPQTEEENVQAQEQEPETRRTVVQQEGTPRRNPTGEPERFEMSPDRSKLINIGHGDDPVYVKKFNLNEEEIGDFLDVHAVDATGKKAIKRSLRDVNPDLLLIAGRIRLPPQLTSSVKEKFPDTDETNIACLVYMSYLFSQLNEHDEESIVSLELLVINVAKLIFEKDAIVWAEKVFELMSRRLDFSAVVEEIYQVIIGSKMDIAAVFMFEEQDQQKADDKPDEGEESEEEEKATGDEDEGDDADGKDEGDGGDDGDDDDGDDGDEGGDEG
jgi:hypothetical protein